MHGEHERIARRAADVVALQRRRRWKHDVGVARGRVPPALVDHDGFRPLPSAPQPIEVLVVVEWIAARPVDQPHVRIAFVPAVELIGAARIEQHVGDPRDRDHRLRRIRRHRHLRCGNVDARHANAVRRAVAEREAAARQSDAAQHRGERDRRPERLFAVVGALQRPRAGDHAAHVRGVARQVADGVGAVRR